MKAATGIDPLTIDQATLAENPAGGLDGQRFARVAPTLGTRSVVLLRDGRPVVIGNYTGAIDLQVVHPPVRRIAGRPAWLATMGRRPSPVPRDLLPRSGVRLVQAFAAREAADAVPIDQVVVTAGQPAPSLMLPPGVAVRYAIEDGIAPR